ncbi:MAG: coproporphyrinogen III oxidase family protein, partial [Bacteroidetes bacterium]
MEAYVEALLREIELYRPLLETARIETVFFGGGTPSWLPIPLLGRIFRRLERLATFAPQELTLEANPEDLTFEKLGAWRALGITRLSVGVQSFSPAVLRTLGRWHRPGQAQKAIQAVAQTGWTSWSVDLIFAVPGQSWQTLQADIDFLISEGVSHLSFYGLTLEPRTVLYKKHQLGRFPAVDEEAYAAQYEALHVYLREKGFQWYEVSNWARPGHECQHNWRYWLRRPYLGLGPSAHSYVPEVRWANQASLLSYLEGVERGELPWAFWEALTPEQIELEVWMTGLRTRLGVDGVWVERQASALRRERIAAQLRAGVLVYSEGR